MSNYGFRILPAPKRPPAALLRQFKNVVVAHLSDSMGRLQGAIDLQPMHKGGHMLGVALTVRVPPGDNLMVHKAIDIAQPGDIIIVDAGGEVTTAIIGEIMSTHAAKRKVAGMVIDGAIRDAGALAKSAFPVYARGVSHRGPYKDGPGEINCPISVGGMVVMPGDIIVGDEDGIVAVPQAEAADLIAKAKKKAADEAETFRQIAKGTIDRSWVDKALKAKGCQM
jgi:regulator of RNase E activity RraA